MTSAEALLVIFNLISLGLNVALGVAVFRYAEDMRVNAELTKRTSQRARRLAEHVDTLIDQLGEPRRRRAAELRTGTPAGRLARSHHDAQHGRRVPSIDEVS